MTAEFEARLSAAVAAERERWEALLSSEARAYRAEAFCAGDTTARVKVDCMAAAIEGVLRKWRAQPGNASEQHAAVNRTKHYTSHPSGVRIMSARLEDGTIVELTTSAPYGKSAAAMEAALMALDTPIVYREPIGLIGSIGKWWFGR